MRRAQILPLIMGIAGMAAIATIAGCDGDDDGAAPTTGAMDSPTTTLDASRSAQPTLDLTAAYVGGLALASAAGSTARPGSDAAHYLDYRRALVEVFGWDSAGSVSTSSTGPPRTDVIAVCDPSGCVEVSDVEVEPGSGQVTTFSIDSVPLATRIGGDGPVTETEGIAGRVRTAYRTNDARLLVVIALSNTSNVDVEVFGFGAVLHADPDGPGTEATGSWGVDRLEPGDSGNLLVAFDDAPLEGRVDVGVLRSDGIAASVGVTLPTLNPTAAPSTS